jgi:hypothetical protein
MPKILTGATLLIMAFKPAPGPSGTRRSWNMDLIDVALLLITVAMIALVPCGCIMTRQQRGSSTAPGTHR